VLEQRAEFSTGSEKRAAAEKGVHGVDAGAARDLCKRTVLGGEKIFGGTHFFVA